MQKAHNFEFRWLLLALIICSCVYYFALSGPFLFDDFPNLSPLISYNEGLVSASEIIFGGSASVLGRPVAMASFLVGSESFPKDPWLFKVINLFIHLMNGVLVFFFSRKLAALTSLSAERKAWLAIICTSIWLLHPFLMSSVLLVVQRMTLLMTFFALASMLAYLKAREESLRTRRSIFIALYIVFGAFSVFSKENGALIPLYLLVLEFTLLNKTSIENSRAKQKVWILVKIPVVMIFLYLIYKLPDFLLGYESRDFSFVERLLTQARIIVDYSLNILLPKLGGGGLFHDTYPISHHLLAPVSTLFCIILIFSVLTAGLFFRKKQPVFAMAVMFFLAGHLLESTIVPLELYFEHRNYLPSIGLIFGGVYFALRYIPKVKALVILIVPYIILLIGFSYLNSTVWGSLSNISSVWAAEKPQSKRAQLLLTRYYGDIQRYDLARNTLKNAELINPTDIPLQFQLIVNECLMMKKIEHQSLVASANIIREGTYSHGVSASVTVLVKMLGEDLCGGISPQSLSMLIEAALTNEAMKDFTSRQSLYFQLGEIQLFQGQFEASMASYDSVHALKPNGDLYLRQVQVSIALGYPLKARYYLTELEKLDAQRSVHQKSYQNEIQELSKLLNRGENVE